MVTQVDGTTRHSAVARERMVEMEGRPALLSDWERVVFIHYRVPAEVLGPLVPFELDLWEGYAYVSLVAFTMKRLRPAAGGRVGAWLMTPIAGHEFLNVRTYVRRGNERGIYFLIEWLPSRLSAMLGPRTFGLPYRYGRLDYEHDFEGGRLRGRISGGEGEGRIEYAAEVEQSARLEAAGAGTLEEFLLERYVAFTMRRRTPLNFRIWHWPWRQTAVEVRMEREDLLEVTGAWRGRAELVGAHYSPGVEDVWIGLPRRCGGRNFDIGD